jgi:hypothetical protein
MLAEFAYDDTVLPLARSALARDGVSLF